MLAGRFVAFAPFGFFLFGLLPAFPLVFEYRRNTRIGHGNQNQQPHLKPVFAGRVFEQASQSRGR